ncbi:protein-glutamate O-methyltransferase CheR [Desulfovibrio subterraneus]|uniref:CheR family methyltransferase n=1 Tax=Desulfovibrio subterraneus TaxID=2718620 RepID=UPI0022B8F359|nr:protein-glutamate O-methyltransferase CheR [Desulfovibrio subterraneus]WBF66553.1 protein-glutamate O-methyltransferase CheR [Desulfovibrio subterraneus]WBF66565.1 protein-glutamate O-methyltransferase CheR [Desulfovibrio subterraneus]
MSTPERIDNERLEIELLLEAIYRKYGYDFRNYACAHTKRRLEHRRALEGLSSYAQMMHHIIYDESFFETVLLDLSINVTEMFRDPWFYKKVRQSVVPHLHTYPFIKVWHAGCSAGQEVYSMGILLEEEGMRERVQIYATDFNEIVLQKAKDGIYPVDLVREYTSNYQKAGGTQSFSDYYTADYSSVVMKHSLRDQVLFSSHNLVTDGVFGEMNVIFCRNVLIYFNRELQNKVLKLFYDSLCPGGFLCLGSKETLMFSEIADKFEVIADREKIYRKKRL